MQVDDDGVGAAAALGPPADAGADDGDGGRGLAGMRERALALGGTAEAGPRPGRGFRVPGAAPADRERRVIRVLLADDQALVRAGFRALLDAQDDIEVVGEAADGDEAVTLARRLAARRVLMDIRMPGHRRARRHPARSPPTTAWPACASSS